MTKHAVAISAIMNGVVSLLQAAVVGTHPYLFAVPDADIKWGARRIEDCASPGVYLEIESTSDEWESTALTKITVTFLVLCTYRDMDPETCAKAIVNLSGDIEDILGALATTEISGAARITRHPGADYLSHADQSGTIRLSWLRFTAEKSIVVT